MMTVLTTITKQMSHYSPTLHQLKWFVSSAGGRHQYFIITQTTVINVINGQTFLVGWAGSKIKTDGLLPLFVLTTCIVHFPFLNWFEKKTCKRILILMLKQTNFYMLQNDSLDSCSHPFLPFALMDRKLKSSSKHNIHLPLFPWKERKLGQTVFLSYFLSVD